MTEKKCFRTVAIALCITMIISLVPGMVFAETVEIDTYEKHNTATVADEYQIVDGQAIKMTQLEKGDGPNCGTVEMQGYYRSTANYDESAVVINGNLVLEFSQENVDSSKPYAGYTRQSTPVLGTAADYTVNQGTAKKNVTTNAIIASMTVNALFAFISPIVSAAYSFVASAIINAAIALGTTTKTAYYKETQKGHKTIPGIYHQYTTKWYLDSSYSKYVSGADSVCYDYWS